MRFLTVIVYFYGLFVICHSALYASEHQKQIFKYAFLGDSLLMDKWVCDSLRSNDRGRFQITPGLLSTLSSPTITDDSLNNLRSEGVPSHSLQKLKIILKERGLITVNEALAQLQTIQYKRVLLKHASIFKNEHLYKAFQIKQLTNREFRTRNEFEKTMRLKVGNYQPVIQRSLYEANEACTRGVAHRFFNNIQPLFQSSLISKFAEDNTYLFERKNKNVLSQIKALENLEPHNLPDLITLSIGKKDLTGFLNSHRYDSLKIFEQNIEEQFESIFNVLRRIKKKNKKLQVILLNVMDPTDNTGIDPIADQAKSFSKIKKYAFYRILNKVNDTINAYTEKEDFIFLYDLNRFLEGHGLAQCVRRRNHPTKKEVKNIKNCVRQKDSKFWYHARQIFDLNHYGAEALKEDLTDYFLRRVWSHLIASFLETSPQQADQWMGDFGSREQEMLLETLEPHYKGFLFDFGIGPFKKDNKAAIGGYQEALDLENLETAIKEIQYKIGLLHWHRCQKSGPYQDLEITNFQNRRSCSQAFHWMEKASLQQSIPATYWLGIFHIYGGTGMEPNKEKGYKLIRAAAEKGYEKACRIEKERKKNVMLATSLPKACS